MPLGTNNEGGIDMKIITLALALAALVLVLTLAGAGGAASKKTCDGIPASAGFCGFDTHGHWKG